MIVVDASVAVKWFVDEPGRVAARNIIGSGDRLTAPDFVVFEVLSVLRRKQRLKLMTERQVVSAAGEIQACFAEFVSAANIAEAALRLSIELDHSVYDCSYLACALTFAAKLITADERFLKKVSRTRHAPHVEGLALSN